MIVPIPIPGTFSFSEILKDKNSIYKKRLYTVSFSVFFLCCYLCIDAKGEDSISPSQLSVQFDSYNADVPKTIIELQPYRKISSERIKSLAGRTGMATLINLNPFINRSFIVITEWDDGSDRSYYHLENNSPGSQHLELDADYPFGIVIKTNFKEHRCDLWSNFPNDHPSFDSKQGQVYTSLSDGRVFLRNKTKGNKTSREWATDFLRDYIWEGDQITTFIREKFFRDTWISTSDEITSSTSPGGGTSRKRPKGAPFRPLIDKPFEDTYLSPKDLGIPVLYDIPQQMLTGRWYPAEGIDGVFISVIEPRHVAENIKTRLKHVLNPLDETELSALTFMVAFDLDMFETGFAMGTDHPRVGWSERVQEKMKDDTLPGPDGIGDVHPIINTGMLNPEQRERVVAAFIGGFKRYHGVFKFSELAWKNSGSHYGFLENGVVMSKLQPGLATAIIDADGRIDLKTWTKQDNERLFKILHARQNGLPIIEFNEKTSETMPGKMVPRTAGNWSGSVDGRYRTLRAGMGITECEGKKFLIYGLFSSATPSAMALVFQSFQVKYAMLLDMNALEHTYLAVYKMQGKKPVPFHLLTGMNVLDKVYKGNTIPRFAGFADNRDFFYLLKRKDL